MSRAERLDVLDGLRGLAILLVVWYHAWLVTGQRIAHVNFFAEAGFLGVDLFFFISGFCLFHPYARAIREGRQLPTTRHFFYRRAVKIVPSYVLALAFFSSVYHSRFASSHDALLQIFSHLTFLHTLDPDTYGSISGPLWTLGVEVQFYLIFPLLCPLFRRAPLLAYGSLVAVSEVYRAALAANGLNTTFWWINQLPAYFDVFGAGMLAAYGLVAARSRSVEPDPRLLTIVSLAAFAAAIAGVAKVSAIERTADINAVYAWINDHRTLIGPLCIVLALSTSLAVTRWRSIIAARALVFLSIISYNLYLWNLEIAVWYHNTGLPRPFAFGLSIATAIAVATVITYFVERPLLETDFRTLWRRPREPSPSAQTAS